MKRMKQALLAALLTVATTAQAGPIGYPGSTWGTIVVSNTGPEKPNFQWQGIVEQGVDWFKFADDRWRLNTYGAASYSMDMNSISNTLAPQVGVKINRHFSDGSLDLGLRYVSQHSFFSSTTIANTPATTHAAVQAYATFWFDWNLKD